MWTVQWQDYEPHEAASLEQLNQVLDEVAASHDAANPVLVQIIAPSGEIMVLGIGGELSVLDHLASDGRPAQHSVGEPSNETIPYMMGIYEAEMPKAYAIPYRVARKAVDHFFLTGRLSEDVTWEND